MSDSLLRESTIKTGSKTIVILKECQICLGRTRWGWVCWCDSRSNAWVFHRLGWQGSIVL